MSKIALLPGGFKPPHAGHYNMAKWLSANTGADTTIIFVGPKERDGITQSMSLKLWKLYTQNDSGLEVRPAGVSPVRDVYDFIEQEAPEGSTVFLGMGEKDVSDTRFKNIPKFAEPKGITFETKLVPPQAGGVSGTEMRGFIKMNDKALFQYSLPEHLSDEQKNEAWDIVTGLEEDLNEGPQFGVLYHFTQQLSQVLGDDTLRGPVSLTRSLDSYAAEWLGDQPYFILDKDKLRTKYKIRPFKDTSDNPDYEEISQYDEMEEVIENDITNLARYTIKVVLPYSDENWENALKEKNIPYEVTGLEEDLYNPEDKVLDYMRSSEYKAGMPDGPKDDIPRTKNQIHNRQTNPHAHMSEAVFSKNWWKTQINEMLSEVKANTHLTHLEELVLTQGQDGFNQAKNFLYELIKNLKGQDNSIKNVSVKWDGAPAVFTGINPDNGQFFVGTKSVFNVNPKINYTPKDIDQNHGNSPGLAKKLKLALQYLPSIGIKNILQGDLMFDNDEVETEDIDGVPHYTFRPNTIRYAVEANSELGKQIIAARIGIIFHTTYNDLSGGGASFGADVSGLSKSPSVWFDDAFFKDDTGILLSEQEEKFVLEKINEADSINVDYTNLPLKNLNTYINSEIRQGEFLDDPSKSFERFKNWYQRAVDKSIEKVSRPESKERKRQAGEEKLREFNSQKQDIINIFKVSKLLSEAKAIFITKYDKAVATKHFIDNGDGTLSVTKAEGFVAVDHTENGIKLVDRLEFSKNNFNAGKPGAKK